MNRHTHARWLGKAGRLWLMVGLIGTMLLPTVAWGQADAATTDTEIAAQVRFTREQFVKLTNTMLEVATLLEENDPETAQVLREAVSQARRAFIAEDMERVASLLKQGLTSAAKSNQQGVIEELKKVLEVLRGGTLDLEERQERINQWRDELRRINRILAEQRRLEQESRVRANEAEIDRQFKELEERLNSLVDRQQELRDQAAALMESDISEATASVAKLLAEVRQLRNNQEKIAALAEMIGIDNLPVLGEVQREASQWTEELAEKIAELAGDAELTAELAELSGDPASVGKAGELVADAAKAMNIAAGHLEEPNSQKAIDRAEDAIADLTAAEQLLEELLGQASANTPAGKLAGQQADLAGETGDLTQATQDLAEQTGRPADTGHIDAAKREMERAAKNLQAQQRDDALDNQDEAIRQLKDEKYRLAQLRQRVKEQAERELADQGAEQQELSEQTKETGEEMAGDDESGQSPGASSVGQAAESMGQAAQKLSGESSSGQSDSQQASDANADQKDAIEKLEQAADELAEAIEEEQKQIEAEQLAKIDELLQKTLDRQRQVSESTVTAYESRDEESGDYDRPEQLKLAELADAEGELSLEVARVRGMLAEEGQAVVFPIVLEQVQDDLDHVQRRLASLNADEMTQTIQADVEMALEEMIASIREELADRRKKEGGGGSGGQGEGGGDSPLVPPIAELKMLRRLEIRISRQTKQLDAQRAAIPADQSDERHARLAERQQQLQEMTQALANNLEQSTTPPGEDGAQP